MKGSLKLGRFLGIDVHVHFTFLLLLAAVAGARLLAGEGSGAVVNELAFLGSLFLCVLLHEFGHALAARRYGIPTRDITLLPIGGVARLERTPSRPAHELVVALAGPAVNLVIAAGLLLGLSLGGHPVLTGLTSPGAGGMIDRLFAANLFLVAFNLIPAFPMDGGRVLRALLALRLGAVRATAIAAGLGRGIAVVFGLLGLFGNPMLLLIAVFVWFGAAQEAAAVEMKSTLEGVTVRDSMLTRFETLHPHDTLTEAADKLLAGSQQDFPVIGIDGRPAGILTRERLFTSLREFGEEAPVADAMERFPVTASPEDRLESILERGDVDRSAPVLVVQDGRLVGLLTTENIVELHMITTAIRPGTHGGDPSRPSRPLPARRSARHALRAPGSPPVLTLTQPFHSPIHD